ncbi:hypothetical protein CSOJ01_07430 [Colletotrichum sojae]|uniref:Uncharacterized protein n=1 Tax=Colletotrichum sojae TaxID=2175907 RepID=A0A8H6J9P4_9PEZI|nr:hypothetical protein CSOJ01_07430 [Colletotrichum sojae]
MFSSQPEEVELIWKFDKPAAKEDVDNILKVHWTTVLRESPEKIPHERLTTPSSALHNKTMTRQGPVPDGWHVTTSWPTTTATFNTAHGYTKGKKDYDVVYSTVKTGFKMPYPGGRETYPIQSRWQREIVSVSYLNSLLINSSSGPSHNQYRPGPKRGIRK